MENTTLPVVAPPNDIEPTPPKVTLPPSATAVAEYMRRQGKGDRAEQFLSRYQSKAAEDPAAAAQRLGEFAQRTREEISMNGTYAQFADIASSLDPPKAAPSKPQPINKVQQPTIAGQPAPEKVAPVRNTDWMSEMGKTLQNGIVDVVAGFTRAPQVLYEGAGAISEGLGIEKGEKEKKTAAYLSKGFQQFGDNAAKYLEHLKWNLDNSGQYDKGLYDRDANGNVDLHLFDGGAVHAIGSGIASVAALFGPGLASKGARLVGIGGRALKAATAAGDVEKVAALTKVAARSEAINRYAFSAATQIEPIYQEALKATGDPVIASRLTAAVVPVVAGIDAFTGIGRSAAGGTRTLTKQAVAQALKRIMKGEITEASFKEVAESVFKKQVIGRAKQMVTGGGEELLTEGVQEGYTIGVEELFDSVRGKDDFKNTAKSVADRVGNAAALGGMLGGGTSVSFGYTAAYQPSAFKALHDAYKSGGQKGMDAVMTQLEAGRGAMYEQGMDEAEVYGLAEKTQRMAAVIQSFDNPYLSIKPVDQFHMYDLTYNQIPMHQERSTLLTERIEALRQDQPFDYQVDENGDPVVDEDGNQAVTNIDPAVAPQVAAGLETELADQGRRVAFLSEVKDVLTKTGKTPAGWSKNFDLIGQYDEGDAIRTPDGKTTTVASVSDNGQTIKTADGDELPVGRIKPMKQQAAAPVAPVSVVGVVPVEERPYMQYKPGDKVYVNGENGAELATFQDRTLDDQGNASITIQRADGEVQTLDENEDGSVDDVLGGYDPDRALSEANTTRQAQERRGKIEKIAAKLSREEITALEAFRDEQIPAQVNILRSSKDKQAKLQGDYLRLRAEEKGLLPTELTEDEDGPIQAPERGTDATADDTPALDQFLGPEVLSEEEIQNIMDTDTVPEYIIDEIALALLNEQPLSEWQMRIFDEDNDAVVAAYYKLAEQVADPTNPINDEAEQIQTVPPADSEGADSGSQAGDAGTASQAANPEGATDAAPDNSGVQPAEPAGAEPPAADVQPSPEPVGSGVPASGPAEPGGAGQNPNGSTPQGQAAPVVNQPTAPAPAPAPEPVAAPLAPERNAALMVGKPGAVKIQNNRGSTSVGMVVTTRDGRALVRYEVNNGTDIKTTKMVEIWVKPSDGVLFAAGDNMAEASPLGVEGDGPLLGDVNSFNPGDVIYTVVPDLGGDVRQVTVVSQLGNSIVVEGAIPGKVYEAYGDQASATKPKGWVDPKEKFKNARKSWGAQTPADGTTARPAVQRVIDRLRQAFPAVTVEMQTADQMGANFGIDGKGQAPLGAYQDGIVYINGDRATMTTPLHEFAHLWGDILAKEMPNRMARGKKLVKGSIYENVARTQYDGLSEDEVMEEAVIRAIEDAGNGMMDANGNVLPPTRNRVKNWVADTFRKLADATGWGWLSPESTLQDWAANEAKDLLAGNVLSEQTSEQLAAQSTTPQARLQLYPPTQPLPDRVDEATMRQYTFDRAQKKQLFDAKQYSVQYDDNGDLVRVRMDTAVDSQKIQDTFGQIAAAKTGNDLTGLTIKALSSKLARPLYGRALTLPTLGKWLFGNDQSGAGNLLGETLLTSRRKTAEVIVSNSQFMTGLYKLLQPDGAPTLSNFKGLVSPDKVRQMPIATVGGADLPLTASEAIALVGRYETIMADYGGFGTVQGQPVTEITLFKPNPDDEAIPFEYPVEVDTIRQLKKDVYADPELFQILQDSYDHLDKSFAAVDQTHLMTEGSALKRSNRYFPLRVAKTEREISARTVNQIIEDVAPLKKRKGPATELWVEDLGGVLERYNRQTETYIQNQALAKNLDHLVNVHGAAMQKAGNNWLYKALEEKFKNTVDPNALAREQLSSTSARLIATVTKLATLSRFTRNIGIRAKQMMGYVSAIGNGELKDQYLVDDLLPTMRMVGKSYGLGDLNIMSQELTDLEQRIYDNPFAGTLKWRIMEGAAPDLQYANLDGTSLPDNPGKLRKGVMKAWAFNTKYGLAGQRIADVSVVAGLYRAAERQVAAEGQGMTNDEQLKEIARLAEHAMYYSNQTVDVTDRGTIQSSNNVLVRMLGLYQGQGFKLFDTMSRRNLEAALEPAGSPERKEAERKFRVAVAINVGLGAVANSIISTAVGAIRNIPFNVLAAEGDERYPKVEDMVWDGVSGALQNLPIVGGIITDAIYAARFDKPMSLIPDPFEPAIKAISGLAGLAKSQTPLATYGSERAKDKDVAKMAYETVRAIPEATGLAGQEEARQVAVVVKYLLAPEALEKKEKTTVSGWGMSATEDEK